MWVSMNYQSFAICSSKFCNLPNVLTNTAEQQREILLLQLIEMQKLPTVLRTICETFTLPGIWVYY